MRKIKNKDRVYIPVSSDSGFSYAEAYKSLRTNIEFTTINKEHKVIAITSTIPGEGKSNVALNTGATLAEAGYKVLVVDCDLRSPMIGSFLGLNNWKQAGLSSIIGRKDSPGSVIQYVSEINVDVLCSGPIPPNPTEMLGSDMMKALITFLREKYDYILIDTPPCIVTDSAVLARISDGIVMVIRQNFALINDIKQAKASLELVGANIIGAIITDYDNDKDGYGRYGYGYGRYGYGNYYSNYENSK